MNKLIIEYDNYLDYMDNNSCRISYKTEVHRAQIDKPNGMFIDDDVFYFAKTQENEEYPRWDRNCKGLPTWINPDTIYWHKNGIYHNLYGPSIVSWDGDGYVDYYIDGNDYTKDEYLMEIERLKYIGARNE